MAHLPRTNPAWPIALIIVVLAVAVAGCRQEPRALSVAAASDVEPAFKEIAKVYESRTGKPVDLILGSSGLLARQVEQGAPVDVFASASKQYIDDLNTKGLIKSGSIKAYARGRLALVQRPGSGARPAGVKALDRIDLVAFAIANPEHAPYGRAAVEALKSSDTWGHVSDKLVYGENVSQAWQFVKSGNADYGLVALSLVKAAGVKYVPVDDRLHGPLVQTAAVVANTSHPAAAREFIETLTGREGRRILEKYGFEVKK